MSAVDAHDTLHRFRVLENIRGRPDADNAIESLRAVVKLPENGRRPVTTERAVMQLHTIQPEFFTKMAAYPPQRLLSCETRFGRPSASRSGKAKAPTDEGFEVPAFGHNAARAYARPTLVALPLDRVQAHAPAALA